MRIMSFHKLKYSSLTKTFITLEIQKRLINGGYRPHPRLPISKGSEHFNIVLPQAASETDEGEEGEFPKGEPLTLLFISSLNICGLQGGQRPISLFLGLAKPKLAQTRQMACCSCLKTSRWQTSRPACFWNLLVRMLL